MKLKKPSFQLPSVEGSETLTPKQALRVSSHQGIAVQTQESRYRQPSACLKQ